MDLIEQQRTWTRDEIAAALVEAHEITAEVEPAPELLVETFKGALNLVCQRAIVQRVTPVALPGRSPLQ